VAIADFNGDGNPDLAVLSEGGVNILLGNADGTFQTSRNHNLGFYPSSIVAADLNGDGKLDLAVTSNPNGTVSILLGNGDGTFQASNSYPVGSTPGSIAVADLSGDGIPDLAVANRGSNTVSVLLGNGDGTFQPRADYAVGTFPLSVAAGDFNGDGHQDLVVVGGVSITTTLGMPVPSTMSILLGNGDGTFKAAQIHDAGFGANSVTVGDLNGDGQLDVVTSNFSARGDWRHPISIVVESGVRVFLGRGDGTFQDAQSYAAGTSPVFVTLSDLNGDGIPNLAVANGLYWIESPHGVTTLLGNGDGTFQAAQNYQAGLDPSCLAAGDLNGDGCPDLVVVEGHNPYPPNGTVTILLNSANWP
jgi:hypothetical protein